MGAARADEKPRLSRILAEHLGGDVNDIVEEKWPGYDQVNVQAGLDSPAREYIITGDPEKVREFKALAKIR